MCGFLCGNESGARYSTRSRLVRNRNRNRNRIRVRIRIRILIRIRTTFLSLPAFTFEQQVLTTTSYWYTLLVTITSLVGNDCATQAAHIAGIDVWVAFAHCSPMELLQAAKAARQAFNPSITTSNLRRVQQQEHDEQQQQQQQMRQIQQQQQQHHHHQSSKAQTTESGDGDVPSITPRTQIRSLQRQQEKPDHIHHLSRRASIGVDISEISPTSAFRALKDGTSGSWTRVDKDRDDLLGIAGDVNSGGGGGGGNIIFPR